VIGWDRDVVEVANLVRALSPHVGARTLHPEVEGPVKIWRARISDRETLVLEAGAIRTENGRLLVGCGVGGARGAGAADAGSEAACGARFPSGATLCGVRLTGRSAAGRVPSEEAG
jgi:methionyl-tRNA formyltransferase